MRVLVTGASGLVGSALVPELEAAAHDVVRLVRRVPTGKHEATWDPARGTVDTAALEGVEAVVHLAGDNIASGRWTKAKKARIRASRVDATRLLCGTLAGCSPPPRIFVGASAIGYYGAHRGSELLTEASAPGTDFLAKTCVEWERASAALIAHSRVVLLRIGVVLSPAGGALARMLTPFRLGIGGRLGSGSQYVSWIALDDLLRVIQHALDNDALAGPCNATAPQVTTNLELTKALGRVLRRPTLLPMPGATLRLLFGEMADALLLSSNRIVPGALETSGFAFCSSDLETTLHHLLDPPPRHCDA